MAPLPSVDDVVNPSGHRLGTAEVESAILEHSQVAEAAVVGFPHDLKGEGVRRGGEGFPTALSSNPLSPSAGIYAFVVIKAGAKETPQVAKEIREVVRKVIGPLAAPDHVMVRCRGRGKRGEEGRVQDFDRVVGCRLCRTCPRRGRVRLCAGCCARLRPTRWVGSGSKGVLRR